MIGAVKLSLLLSICQIPAQHAPAQDDTHLAAQRARAAVVRHAVATVRPATVRIETIGGMAATGGDAFQIAEGPTTGVIVSADGLILTSHFNFIRKPTVIDVTLADGRRFVARLLAKDHIRRLALLKIDAENLPLARWANHQAIQVGQYVVAAGLGFGGDQPFASLGIVSAVDRRNGNAIQTDAKTSPANYGGPLLNIDGEVIGLIVPMVGDGSALAGAQWYDGGIGFAVHRSSIDRVLDRLSNEQNIEAGKMGIMFADNDQDDGSLLDQILSFDGVVVKKVYRDSPAQQAGIEADDRITAIDGLPVSDLAAFKRMISDRAAGDRVRLTVRRRWKQFELSFKLVRGEDIDWSNEDRLDFLPDAPNNDDDE